MCVEHKKAMESKFTRISPAVLFFISPAVLVLPLGVPDTWPTATNSDAPSNIPMSQCCFLISGILWARDSPGGT